MLEISSSDLRTRLAELLRTAEDGEPVVITRHGKPTAALIPADQLTNMPPPASERASSEDTDRTPADEPVAGSGDGTAEPTPKELRAQAMAPTLRRIELDLDRLPDKLKPVLVLIRDNLLQPRLTVERIKQAIGVGANDLTTQFGDVAGESIGKYREDRRLECACRLLVDTQLDVKTIASLLGYPKAEALGRAFKRRYGVRPPIYREFGGRLSPEALEAAQPGRAAVVPRYVAGLSALASQVHCRRCDDVLEPGVAMRVFRDLAPICDACARERAPELVAALGAGTA